MAKTSDPVADAEHEAAEAEHLVEALEERVRDGDDSVTPEQVEQQRGLSHFARLRVEAARRKAEKAREKERRRQLDALRADIDARDDDVTRIVELRAQAEQAVEAFAQACDDRNRWIRQTVRRMKELDVPNGQAGERDPSGLGWVASATGNGVFTSERGVKEIRAGAHVADIVHQVAARHGGLPVGGTDLHTLVHRVAVPARLLEVNRG
ncbi:hypothetical protein HDA32_005364 [Spinactinospora alkalitolerans]|uniref:Uncharacterized protein n=1 Tax=Spinactinospora alkalitolerans TaxID=687207 RepID=A0A852U855_9ACTN|nr:hypothetical protein [Spinactinospora alkalitolerans]NYE50244.1 hypothetical protein [Spinactinospora alkalitolerans]